MQIKHLPVSIGCFGHNPWKPFFSGCWILLKNLIWIHFLHTIMYGLIDINNSLSFFVMKGSISSAGYFDLIHLSIFVTTHFEDGAK